MRHAVSVFKELYVTFTIIVSPQSVTAYVDFFDNQLICITHHSFVIFLKDVTTYASRSDTQQFKMLGYDFVNVCTVICVFFNWEDRFTGDQGVYFLQMRSMPAMLYECNNI